MTLYDITGEYLQLLEYADSSEDEQLFLDTLESIGQLADNRQFVNSRHLRSLELGAGVLYAIDERGVGCLFLGIGRTKSGHGQQSANDKGLFH